MAKAYIQAQMRHKNVVQKNKITSRKVEKYVRKKQSIVQKSLEDEELWSPH